ncbi:hypothetical protein C8R45DRAFT_987767 [Mycena sanguinolenta]|nr:hypothetical protein C8R45DRAFT_987767 [Mycena sanguinolenta]
MFSLIAQLLCCGVRPRAASPDVQSTVIPTERSHLLDDSQSPAIVVDHQKLSDKLGTIVRAKEGKMVSVSARTPFTLHDAEPPNLNDGGSRVNVSRRPPVLTMTPARSHGSLNLYSDSRSRHSSRSCSRSSSRQPHLRSHSTSSGALRSTVSRSTAGSASVSDTRAPALDASEWVPESESEFSVEDESSFTPGTHGTSKTPAMQPTSVKQPSVDMRDIAFDWDA